MGKSLLLHSRVWHRRVASLLFVFFFLISLTGLLLGCSFLFKKTIFDNSRIKAASSRDQWLSLDSLETLATASLNEKTRNHFKQAESILLKPAKGYISFSFKNNYNVQVDGATGATIHIEQKSGGWIKDIHDGAIVDKMLTGKSGITKATYSTVMALALLFLTLSGFYLWYKPKRIRQLKKVK